MGDVLFLVLAVGFFGLAAAYVRACAAVVGREPTQDMETASHRRGGSEASV